MLARRKLEARVAAIRSISFCSSRVASGGDDGSREAGRKVFLHLVAPPPPSRFPRRTTGAGVPADERQMCGARVPHARLPPKRRHIGDRRKALRSRKAERTDLTGLDVCPEAHFVGHRRVGFPVIIA
jgi:hypothetical protein